MRLRKPAFQLSYKTIIDVCFVLFFCNPLLFKSLRRFMTLIGAGEYVYLVGLLIIYVPVVVALLLHPGRIPWDFVGLFLGILLYFTLTYLIHPEYEHVYSREGFGVWDYVLIPFNGIYAYLFVRIIKDPKKMLFLFRICSYLMLLYFLKRLMGAIKLGYWEETDALGTTRMPYSVQFGYDVLLYALVLLYAALKERRLIDIIGAAGGLVMIFLGGSRGPLLDIGIFFALYVLIKAQRSRKKYLIITLIILSALAIYYFYTPVLKMTMTLLSKFGLKSRFLTKLVEGSVTDDSGRDVIWKAAIDMIKTNPFGYGAMGTRHVIYKIIGVGHPHNIFLEILVDTGVFIGTLIILVMGIRSAWILFGRVDLEWKGLFLVAFATSCQLLLSGTLWHRAGIWVALGLSTSIGIAKRKLGGKGSIVFNAKQQNEQCFEK